jgi:UDP-N-acetylmuramate-alanine ligase
MSVLYSPDKKRVVDCLEQALRPGDLLVTLGAGDVVKFGEEYLKRGR